jgi:hypothetical protein
MAEQNFISRPLKDESEEEKRRREAAQNYLDSRAAFTASQKPGYSVDMTDMDTSGMSDEQIRAEGNKRLEGIKSNFQQSVISANEAGFNNAQAAQDYLNKGQARIVGDTLVGSAAGIPASIWEKRDKAAAAGSVGAQNFPGPPSENMVEMAPGVKMGEETAGRYATNMRGAADAKAKARADMDSVLKKAQEFRTSIAKDNLPGGKSFEEGREKWQATLKAREDEKNLNDLVKQDMQFAGREAASARRNYYALERAQRSGKEVDPRLMQIANETLSRLESGLGPTNNVNDRQKRFRAVREGEPPTRSQGMGLQGQPIDSGNFQSMFDLRSNPYGSPKKRQPMFGSLV